MTPLKIWKHVAFIFVLSFIVYVLLGGGFSLLMLLAMACLSVTVTVIEWTLFGDNFSFLSKWTKDE